MCVGDIDANDQKILAVVVVVMYVGDERTAPQASDFTGPVVWPRASSLSSGLLCSPSNPCSQSSEI
jgi:hypothetical protein